MQRMPWGLDEAKSRIFLVFWEFFWCYQVKNVFKYPPHRNKILRMFQAQALSLLSLNTIILKWTPSKFLTQAPFPEVSGERRRGHAKWMNCRQVHQTFLRNIRTLALCSRLLALVAGHQCLWQQPYHFDPLFICYPPPHLWSITGTFLKLLGI